MESLKNVCIVCMLLTAQQKIASAMKELIEICQCMCIRFVVYKLLKHATDMIRYVTSKLKSNLTILILLIEFHLPVSQAS